MTHMKPSPVFSRMAAVLIAIALGALLGLVLAPAGMLSRVRGTPAVRIALGVVAAAGAAAAAIGLGRSQKSSPAPQEPLSRDLLEAFLEHIPDNVYFKDRASQFIRISAAMAAYCGLKNPRDAINKTDADVFSAQHAAEALADEQQILQQESAIVQKEERETWPDGHETWVLTTKVPLRNAVGNVIGTMGISHNITDRKQAELRIRHMALHDPLTGLPNRVLLEERLGEMVAAARQRGSSLAILMLDLDRFMNINDSFGHSFGDRLLESAALRLRRSLGADDTLARVGEDEFAIAVLLPSGSAAIEPVAQKVLNAFSAPFLVEGNRLQISASLGMSQFPADGDNPRDLLQFADAAMHEAKRRGRGRFCCYSRALTDASRRRQKMESDLLQALPNDEFVLHYQPFVEAKSGRISGAEALLRWRHPELGLLSPYQFIPQLEELGLMPEIGRWVLRTACNRLVEWQRDGLPAMRIAVNISQQQLFEGNIVDTVRAVLQETRLQPQLLELELTESQSLDDSEATLGILQNLRRLGVGLSLDDFGSGWSSFSSLRRFPIQRIKFGRSFVRDAISQPTADAVVRSMVGLSRSLGIGCLAKGVETPEERDYLRALQCEELQGFLFSQPLTAFDIRAHLRAVLSPSAAAS